MAQIILDSNNNLIQGDFDNATLNNRTKLQTTTTNATTNVYVVPNGSSTSAGVSVANNSSLTNASKIVMATNGSTDTQIISGVNGSGTYLPLSFYTNNALAAQIGTDGSFSATGGIIANGATKYYALNSSYVGANATGAQSMFGVGVTLDASTQYEFEYYIFLAKTAGATSHTIAPGFGGTATFNNFSWMGTSFNWTGAGYNTYPVSIGNAISNGLYTAGFAANTNVAAVATNGIASANSIFYIYSKGIMSVNASGTFIPQYTLSAAPGGAYSTQAGSFIKITKLGASGSNINIGSWS